MVENEAFDDVIEGPVAQLGRERSTALEIERARARQLDRAADPIRPVSSSGKRVGAEPAVKQNAEFVAIAGNAIERIERNPLEACDPIEPDPQFGCQILQLAAIVDREHRQILMTPPPPSSTDKRRVGKER